MLLRAGRGWNMVLNSLKREPFGALEMALKSAYGGITESVEMDS
jgi:hypothetical protein